MYIEFVKLVTEINSKIQKPKTYNKIISNPIYGNNWKKTIDEELWNLDFYQTWTYTFLPVEQKPIGSK